MFELTLSISIDNQKYLKNLKLKLEEIVGKYELVILHNEENRTYLALAVGESKKELIKSKVLDEIVFIIEDYYKYNFFKEKIENSASGIFAMPFLKAISIFDEENDKEVIKSKLDFSSDIFIDRFFEFKLAFLKSKWEKTADIILQNGIVASDDSMIEVVKYLIAGSNNFSHSADVNISEKEIKLTCENETKIFDKTNDGLSKFLTEIIALNPSKINCFNYYNDLSSSKTQKYLSELFGDKIYL